MFALYQISTNTVIQEWDSLPKEISLAQENLIVFTPNTTWTYGDYMLIPVTYIDQGRNTLSISNGASRTIRQTNTHPELIVTALYSSPNVADAKTIMTGRIHDEANSAIANLSIDIPSILEAYEIKLDPSPTPNAYPIHALLLDTTIDTISKAANVTLTKFKTHRDRIAHIHSTRNRRLASVDAANTINDILSPPPLGVKIPPDVPPRLRTLIRTPLKVNKIVLDFWKTHRPKSYERLFPTKKTEEIQG
jgi:hypothetical protein